MKKIIIFLIICFGVLGCQHKQNRTIENNDSKSVIELPSDFQYVITETRENPASGSNSIFVEINQKLPKEQLGELSEKIKSEQKYRKVVISYVLPQNTSGIAWATVSYNPDLKIEIIGSTFEDEKNINEQIKQIKGEIIGLWYEEEYTSSTKVLYKNEGKLFLATFKKQFGSNEISSDNVAITESKHSQGSKLTYKNEHGEYYVLSSDKQRLMFFNAENKCFTTALPLNSDIFNSKNSLRNKELEIKGNTSAAYTKKEASKEMSRKVYIIVQEFIKQNLQYPDKTKFSDNYSVEDLGNDLYYIVLPIVAENKMGQKDNITCKFKLKFNGKAWEDSKNWTVIEKEM